MMITRIFDRYIDHTRRLELVEELKGLPISVNSLSVTLTRAVKTDQK